MISEPRQPSFLQFLPVSLFGIVISLTGLSYSWGWANKLLGLPVWPMEVCESLALIFFVLITVAYVARWIKYPALVKAEFDHPVSVSFFGTFIISLLLIPGFILAYSVAFATAIWCCGAVLIFVFAWLVLRKWLDNQQEPGNAVPAWIIPVVGTLDVPIIGYQISIPGIHEICLMFFSAGLLFGIILMVIIISRLIFQPPLPEALQPTLLILIGPFALAYSGYESLTGSSDMASAIFYYFDLFLLIVLVSKIMFLPKSCPFKVTWWAVGFPLVAITIASFRYASHKTGLAYHIVPAVLLSLSTIVIAYLLYQTIYRFATHQLLLPQTNKIAA